MKNFLKWLVIVDFLLILFFAFHYYSLGNLEFVLYNLVLVLIIVGMIFLYKRYKLSMVSLVGLSVWGLLHMIGGSTLISATRPYSWVFFNIGMIGDTPVLRYDQVLHFYFYVVATFILYDILKKHLSKDAHWPTVAVILVFAGMGVGAGNEIIEFLPVFFNVENGVGGYFNTLLDIIFNTLGAIAAVLYIGWKKR